MRVGWVAIVTHDAAFALNEAAVANEMLSADSTLPTRAGERLLAVTAASFLLLIVMYYIIIR